jgi:Protein of unknown function (DUF992)
MVKTKLRMAAALAAVFGAAAALISPASAASGVAVGMLSCNVSSGWGFIFGSSRALNCTLTGTNGVSEHYTGNITKFGADIGYTSCSATVGVGLGANALIGGSGNTIALQPLSISGSTGLNVAAGIAAITLTYAP